jgi:hypothetical protein
MTKFEGNKKVVLIAHAIDTEGPLYESLDAKFEMLQELFKIDSIKHTRQNFIKLQNGEIPLQGLEVRVQEMLSGHRVNYNDTWDKIDEMMTRLMSDNFRMRLPDSKGEGWKFTWHALDHVGFEYNPRRRDMGFHNIFDYYNDWVKGYEQYGDDLQWHFHPMSVYRDAHRCATAYFRNDLIYQILCRKIIERNWFPSVFRAGFQAERPDSHWFLEQWIPFDITNMAVEDPSEFDKAIDFKNGRSGNWRDAPADWSIYHPHHDNYQLPGNCRRWIGRALNVMSRIASINQKEVDKAFAKADKENQPVLMAVTGHDFRNLETEVDFVRKLIEAATIKFPAVNFEYCTVEEAFRRANWPDGVNEEKLKLSVFLNPATTEDVPNITVKTTAGKVFGPQPFLAIKTRSRRFIHDNLDFLGNEGEWGYAFHSDTLPIDDVEELSIAANDKYGNTAIAQLDMKSYQG